MNKYFFPEVGELVVHFWSGHHYLVLEKIRRKGRPKTKVLNLFNLTVAVMDLTNRDYGVFITTMPKAPDL